MRFSVVRLTKAGVISPPCKRQTGMRTELKLKIKLAAYTTRAQQPTRTGLHYPLTGATTRSLGAEAELEGEAD